MFSCFLNPHHDIQINGLHFKVISQLDISGCASTYLIKSAGQVSVLKLANNFSLDKNHQPIAPVNHEDELNRMSLNSEKSYYQKLTQAKFVPKVYGLENVLLPDDTLEMGLHMQYLAPRHYQTLKEYRDQCAGPAPQEIVNRIFYELASALDQIHKAGIYHKDIKLENIFISKAPTSKNTDLKVIDFGIAQMGKITTRVSMGASYAAPIEQYRPGQGTTGPKSDVYSACHVLYTLYTNQDLPTAPQRAGGKSFTPLPQACPQLAPKIAAIVDQGLSMHPDQRPSVQEILDLLPKQQSFVSVAGPICFLVIASIGIIHFDAISAPLGQLLNRFGATSNLVSNSSGLTASSSPAAGSSSHLSVTLPTPSASTLGAGLNTTSQSPFPGPSASPSQNTTQNSQKIDFFTNVDVCCSWLHKRTQPNIHSKIDAHLPKGTPMQITGHVGRGWVEVRVLDNQLSHQHGYVFAQYLEQVPDPLKFVTLIHDMNYTDTRSNEQKIIKAGEKLLAIPALSLNNKYKVLLPDSEFEVDISSVRELAQP